MVKLLYPPEAPWQEEAADTVTSDAFTTSAVAHRAASETA
jgi:hypothetical protein